jgi:SNF2 family DNA or RNA helicase
VGSPAQRLSAIHAKADVYLLSRDNVAWFYDAVKGKPEFDMLVVDESSSFKNPKSKRFKALRKMQPLFSKIVLLTGTPSPNGLLDLWSQVYLIDRGERLGKTLTAYRDGFFNPDKRNGHIVYSYKLKPNADVRINAAISDVCMSMKSEDYLDIPELIENDVLVELQDNLMERYKEFEKEKIMEIIESDGEITAMNAAALANKLLQFANGAIYDEDRNVHEVHELKLDACEELIEAAQGRPVLIARTYQHDRDRLLRRLKAYDPVELSGDKDVDDWNAGKIKVLIMHPASGGHGLNLQDGGNQIIWFGQTWSLELWQQLNKRLHRQGQSQRVVVNKIIAEGTIDQDVVKAIEKKAQGQDGLMAALKSRLKKYEQFVK